MRAHSLLLFVLAAGIVVSGCAETVRLSRGSRIPPEHRGVSSAEVTEAFTRHVRGERVSMAATLIDFSYIRAVVLERGRSREQEREAFDRYVKRQTSYYVNLVVHGLESCSTGRGRPPSDEGDDDGAQGLLDLNEWGFEMRTSSGRPREPESIEPGATQLAPSGGCLVQGYLHFPGSISSRDEWVELEASGGDRGRIKAVVRWSVERWTPAKRSKSSGRARPRPRPADEERDTAPEPVETSTDDASPDQGSEPGEAAPPSQP
jgi:hypothetical protein